MTVTDTTGFQAIRNGCTSELPSGSARQAWKNLVRIFQPKSVTQKFELEQRFNHCQLVKETKNPDEWFTELEHIRLLLLEDHQLEYEDSKVIQHILYNLKPKSYETLVMILKRDLGKGCKMDLSEVKEEIRQSFGSQKNIKSSESALAANQYKGKCRICGKQGHKGQDCWSNDKNKSKRPKGYVVRKTDTDKNTDTANTTTDGTKAKLYCEYCKKDNHTEDRCFKKLRDMSDKTC
jgi:hypothetical protein